MLLILIYGLTVWCTPRLRLRLDQAGDNAYYLGLLFTLTSMAFALYGVNQGVGDDTSSGSAPTEGIIADFGLALASTIAGIFVRIALQQMRIDPSEVEHASRQDLTTAAGALRAELADLGSRTRSFHEALMQSSQDLSRALAAEIAQTTKDISTLAKSASAELVDGLKSAGMQVPQGIHHVVEGIAETTAELKNLVKGLRTVSAPVTTISGKLHAAGEAMGATSEALKESSDRIGASLGQVVDIQSTLVRLGSQLDTMVQAVPARDEAFAKRVAEALGLLADAQSRTIEAAKEHASLVSQISIQSRDSIVAVDSARAGSVAVLLEIESASRKLVSAIASAERALEGSSANLSGVVVKSADVQSQLAAVVQSMQGAASVAASSSAETQQRVARGLQAIEAAHAGLVATTERQSVVLGASVDETRKIQQSAQVAQDAARQVLNGLTETVRAISAKFDGSAS